MNTVEWLLMILVSMSLLLLTLLGIAAVRTWRLAKQVRHLKENQPKKQKKLKRWKRELKKVAVKKKFTFKISLLLLVLVAVSATATIYLDYYLTTNMSSGDSENIVTGNYLITQLTLQLEELKNESDSSEKIKNNIQTLGVRLASFSAMKSDRSTSKEGQLLLNRYYQKIGQFGINISGQDYSDLQKEDGLLEDYLADLNQLKMSFKDVLTFYSVDESSLTRKKDN